VVIILTLREMLMDSSYDHEEPEESHRYCALAESELMRALRGGGFQVVLLSFKEPIPLAL